MYQARFILGLVIAAGAAALALQAGVRQANRSPIPQLPVPGIDGDPVYIDPDVVAGGGDPGCLAVGGTTSTFSRIAHAMRGNVYRITKSVTLTEVVMQLTVPTGTELYVGIWRRASDSTAAWVRYPSAEAADIVILEPEGGTLAFQRSGPLEPPLPLESGYDYLIGFAWAESTVFFARDSAGYPAATPPDMSFGQVRGLFGLNGGIFSEGELVDQFANSAISIFNLGAHSMQLCVAGACCYTAGLTPRCVDVSREECNGLIGQFTGSGLTCEEIGGDAVCPLPNGACCLATNSCTYTNEFSCETRGGESWMGGSFCGSSNVRFCAPRGGCCFSGGGCEQDMFEDECEDAGGFWRGDGVACSPSACASGGCCFAQNQQCQDGVPETKCLGGQGRFLGNGVPCATDSCFGHGACCNPATGACIDNLTQPQCASVGGRVYRGDDTICSALRPACGKGACCTPGAGCQDANGEGFSSTECSSLAGTYKGDGTSCFGLQDQCPGTCCFGDQASVCSAISTPDTCRVVSDGGGLFVGYNKPCVDDPLDADQTAEACENVTVQGGCCMPTGECVNMGGASGTATQLQQTCQSQMSGTWIAGSGGCTPGACAPIGACCADSTCTDNVTQSMCMANQGVWDQGTDCDSFNPPCEPIGACCDREQLDCSDDVRESVCLDQLSGEFHADQECSELAEPCESTGACCVPGEGCVEGRTITQCFTDEGTYQGDDTVCVPEETCVVRGACCMGTSCSVETMEDCSTGGGQYRGDGTDCGPAGDACIPRGGCCTGLSCTPKTEALCVEPARYLGDDTTCGANACAPKGACCPADQGTCIAASTQSACEASDGTYAGDDTVCNDNLCTTGACCLPDCTCDDDPLTMPNGAECLAQGGQFVTQATCDEAGCGQGIVSSDPEDCRIDARQPHEPTSTSPPIGQTSIVLTFVCATPAPVIGDFEIFGTPGPGISISNFAVAGDEATLTFSGPIPPGQYTCVRHIPSGDEVCLGYLPGDVNSDGIATTDELDPAADDVQVLAEFLKNGTPDLEIWQCDIDRSGDCTVLDIGREIDLLNGADAFTPWLGMEIGGCPSVPAVGACCVGDICSDLNEDECAGISGVFRTGTCGDLTICAPRGACCANGECSEVAELTCTENGGTYVGDDVACEEGTCIPSGACCVDQVCENDSTAAECDTAGGIYIGDDTTCAVDTCDVGACCTCDCAVMRRAECDTTIAVFHEGENCDAPAPCELDIASSTPPSCAIDARQYQDPEMLTVPVDPKDPKGPTMPVFFGPDHLLLTMNCDAAGLTEDNFTLFADPQQTTLDLDHVVVQESTVDVVFDELLEPRKYACVEFDGTFTTKCVGFLPGDVDGSLKSEAADTFALIDHLEEDLPTPLGFWQCDLDRSGACTPLDILRHIEILEGINTPGTFWKDAQIDPCPAE